MKNNVQSRTAAATGAVFAVVLFVANGQGGQLSAPREVAATAAITFLVPFSAYLGVLIREHGHAPDAWLATTSTAAAAVGAAIKLASGAPELALSRAGTATGTPMYSLVDEIGGAATVISLIPLAVFCLAAGLGCLRTRVLPRWLGVAGLVTAATLAVNACAVHTDNVPAMLAMTLWCLLASIHLVRTAGRTPAVTSSLGAVTTA
jgi:hypothetical protein